MAGSAATTGISAVAGFAALAVFAGADLTLAAAVPVDLSDALFALCFHDSLVEL